MAEDISNKVKKIVADHLGIDEAKVTDEASSVTFASSIPKWSATIFLTLFDISSAILILCLIFS